MVNKYSDVGLIHVLARTCTSDGHTGHLAEISGFRFHNFANLTFTGLQQQSAVARLPRLFPNAFDCCCKAAAFMILISMDFVYFCFF